MNKRVTRNALGRGLSNLIPVQEDKQSGNEEVHSISIDSIIINPFQPRIDFNNEEIESLAQSIKMQGLLQPIVVRKKENKFEIISGERRLRAFKFLKRDTIPSLVKHNVTDREMLELALIENIQREELNDIEKAIAYQKLLLEYNYTHEQLSEQVGKSRTAISNSLRLLNLPEEIQMMVRKEQISMGHARALLAVKKELQLDVAQKIINEQMSVRDVEKLNHSNANKKAVVYTKAASTSTTSCTDPILNDVLERLQYKLGTAVQCKTGKNGKGKIEISFFGQDDISRIIDLLLG